ncbi:hypothetical protein EIG64_25390 [Escherichia coli]|nr:hypothetical protein [Escherichia coli]EFN6852357.1 hypothetical protein [Escherichia coli]
MTFLQRTFTSLVHAHAGRTQSYAIDGKKLRSLRALRLFPRLIATIWLFAMVIPACRTSWWTLKLFNARV